MNQQQLDTLVEKLGQEPSNPAHWEQLYRILWPFLLARMYRKLKGNRYLGEEACQEVMLRILRYFDFSRPNASTGAFLKYLNGTCNSVLMDLYRGTNQERLAIGDGNVPFDDTPGPQHNPEQLVILQEKVEHATQKLTIREREILSFLMKGMSSEEIAKQTGAERKTVQNVISDIRRKLRAFLFGQSPREIAASKL